MADKVFPFSLRFPSFKTPMARCVIASVSLSRNSHDTETKPKGGRLGTAWKATTGGGSMSLQDGILDEELWEVLKEAVRRKLGLSEVYVYEVATVLGVNPSFVYLLLKGKRRFGSKVRRRIEMLLKEHESGRIVLMNSTMCPAEGTYVVEKITPEIAKQLVQKADKVESYIGYPQTAEYMSRVLGIAVPVNRGETVLHNGDTVIVCKLKYRVANPATKGEGVNEEDFEWWKMTYKALQ